MPMIGLGQEDIERYKVYDTTNLYTSLLLDFTLIEKSKELSMNQFKKNVFAVF